LKICADENVAIALSKLIREQLLSRENTLDTVDDHQARGVDDELWVRKFANAGGEAIVGADFNMTKKPHEVTAIHETGLRLVILDEKWVRQKKHIQIAFLFFWWPEIEQVLATADKGKCFKVPWSWPADTNGLIKPLPIDLQKAYKQIRKGK
jgi:PIN like domain